MKSVKRLLSALLAAIMIFSSVPIVTFGTGEYIPWEVNILSEPTEESGENEDSGENTELLPNSELYSGYIVVDDNGKTTHYEDDDGNVIEMGSVKKNLLKATTYPSSYDARTDGIVTSVKNQGSYGTCWSFASIANMETYLLKNGMADSSTLDLSENHLIWFTKFLKTTNTSDRTYGDGANASNKSTAYNEGGAWFEEISALTRGSGPVSESVSSYGADVDESLRYAREYSVENCIYMENPTAEQIKSSILEYGSVLSVYNSTNAGYSVGNFYDPSNSSGNPNHAICIVGWDDNYSASNFKNTPASDGAWLVKNSWGTDSYYMDNGYFWLSYCDETLIYAQAITLTDAVDNIYQYECSGPAMLHYYGSSVIKGANVFVADADETISSVGFYAFQTGSSCRVRVITLNSASDTPDEGTVVSEQNCTIDFDGYITVNLDTPVTVSEGQAFAVEVMLDTGNSSNYSYIFSEGYSGALTANVSYISQGDSYEWEEAPVGNLCIKANAVTPEIDIWDGTIATGFESGTGTEDDPYIIKTPEQLAYLASTVNAGTTYSGKYIKLANDIYLNDTTDWENWGTTAPTNTWTPIGTSSNYFSGTFDGDSYAVFGIYADSTKDYQGLFGYSGGTIQNLGIEKSYVCGKNNIGGVCGYNYYGNIANCYNTGNMNGLYYNVGGVCGSNYYGKVTNCYNTGAVGGDFNVGGVCGNNYYGSVTRCYNTGLICGSGDHVGGVSGENYYDKVTNCYNTGSVSGNSNVGGVCGYRIFGNLENCYNTGSVCGSDNYIGGVCGYNSSTATNCYYLSGCATDGSGTIQYGIGNETKGITTADVKGKVRGLTDAELKIQENFVGFDFCGTWAIEPSTGYEYPQFIENVDASLYSGSAIWDGTVANGFASGKGTKANPYIIETAEQLVYLAQKVNNGTNYSGKYFKLANDIVLSDTSIKYWGYSATVWTPIGDSSNYFSGIFDGGGHTVSGIYTDSAKGYCGLFGNSNGTIQNLGVEDSYICGLSYTGGVCGSNEGTVSDCYNTGTVCCSVSSFVGGVCGENYKGTISNCYNTGTVSGSSYTGGVCGYNYSSSTVTNCHNTGAINGYEYVGGVCGSNDRGYGNACFVSACYNTGAVSGNIYVGGVCGHNYGSKVTNCHNTGAVNGKIRVGGVCGNNSGTVTSCYNIGAVNGASDYVGGICGYMEYGTISYCYNTGSVDGNNYVGGVCGYLYYNYGTITTCYNTGAISGYEYIGGVCGYNSYYDRDQMGTITTCYNCGMVDGSSYYIGGICGYNCGTVNNCYYLSGCSKDGDGVIQYGFGNGTQGQSTADTVGKTVGLSGAQMQQYASFVDFDFISDWTMPCVDSEYKYPVLRAFNEHVHTFTDTVVEPTCAKEGYTRHICYCGYEEKDNYIDALDHVWGTPTYEWNGDECTATRVCGNDSSHVETETVTGVYVKDTDATCTTNEAGHYEATFENDAFTSQSTAANSVEKSDTALNHNYGTPTYEWNGDRCTATRVCGNDGSHIETETVTGVYVKDTDATCTENEKGHYEATFTNPAFEKQCTPANSVEKYGTALNHIWGTPTYEWNGDKCTATRVCSRDNTHIETETVTAVYVMDSAADCDVNEKGHYVATFTNSAFASQSTEANSVEKSGTALSHTWEWVTDKEATDDEVGYKHEECTHCHEKRNLDTVIPKLKNIPDEITTDKYAVADTTISNITPGTTVATLISSLNEKQYVKVFKGTTEVSGTTKIGTGMTVSIMDGTTVVKSYTVVIFGDINGDGEISITDMLAIKAALLKKSTLTGVYKTAGDTNNDGNVSITDFLQIKSQLLKKSTINQRAVK